MSLVVSRGKRTPRTHRPPAARPLALTVGATVQPSDKGNYGWVVALDSHHADVYFRNPDTGAEATVTFPREALTVVRNAPAGAAPTGAKETPKERNERLDKTRRQAAYAARKRAELLGDEGDAPTGRDLEAQRNPDTRNTLKSGWNASHALNSSESIEYLGKEGYSFVKVSTLTPHIRATRKK